MNVSCVFQIKPTLIDVKEPLALGLIWWDVHQSDVNKITKTFFTLEHSVDATVVRTLYTVYMVPTCIFP